MFFFFNDTATTEIYTLSLHDALPISRYAPEDAHIVARGVALRSKLVRGHVEAAERAALDRKSTRLNSSHSQISYAVFCLKKKKRNETLRPCSSCACWPSVLPNQKSDA